MQTIKKITIITLFISSLLAMDPIIIKGNRFFNKVTGEGFWIKGLDYQPKSGYPDKYDPLADDNIEWFREDVKRFSDIGVNVIRVYEVHGSNKHGLAMEELEKAGIRLMLDIPEYHNAIDRSNPSWTIDLFDVFKAKIDEFIQYPALFAFVAGNEVANLINETAAMPYVKASIRDIKAYIKSKGKTIPVGYAATDVPTIRDQVQAFLDCGDDSERADFYGVNTYSWCSPSTYEIAYKQVTESNLNSDVPVIFTEFGCNYPNRTRDFAEIKVILGPLMNSVISGGFVFEYSEEVNSFGIGRSYYNNKTFVPFADYYYLKQAYTTVSPTGPSLSEYVSKGIKKECPTQNAKNWIPESIPLPRTPSDPVCECIKKKLTCRSVITDPTKITADDGLKIGSVFSYICGSNSALCTSVSNDYLTGNYGNYSYCDPLTTISVVMSLYYNSHNQDPQACDFDGFATIVKPENINCGYELDNSIKNNSTDIVIISKSQNANTKSSSSDSPNQSTPETSAQSNPINDNSGIIMKIFSIILLLVILL